MDTVKIKDETINSENPLASSAGRHKNGKSFMAAPSWARGYLDYMKVFRQYMVVANKHNFLLYKGFDVLRLPLCKSNGFSRINTFFCKGVLCISE